MNGCIYVDCFVTNTCITRMPSESTINSLSFLQLAFRNNRLCCCFWQTSTFEIGRFCIVTAHQWSCEKVMFLVVCVCQSIFSKGEGSHHTGPQPPFCTRPSLYNDPPPLTCSNFFIMKHARPTRRQWEVGILLECSHVFGSFGKMSKCRHQGGCCIYGLPYRSRRQHCSSTDYNLWR